MITSNYLTWTCARCHRDHYAYLREDPGGGGVFRVESRIVDETVVKAATIAAEHETTYRILGEPTDLNCSVVGGGSGPHRDSIWDAEVQKRLRAAISYTVLDPDEQAALIRAIQREMRAD